MSENILYKFAKDLSQLYAKIQIKNIEKYFLKIAETLDAEIENWLAKAIQLDYKSSLAKPEILDTLILLARLKKSYPAGFSSSEFIKIIGFDNKLKFFIPIIISLREIADGRDYSILSPYKNILDSTRNLSISIGGTSQTALIAQDIESLERLFKEEIERRLNRPYEEDAIVPKRKMNKKERIGNLLHYLTRKFSEEISIAFEEVGQIDSIGITDDYSVVRNPVHIIRQMFPDYPPQNIPGIIRNAKEIVREIIRFSEPQYYDFVFNYIKNKVMMNFSVISKKQFDEFNYQAGLNFHILQDDISERTNTIDIPSISWTFPRILILLSMVLYILGSKS